MELPAVELGLHLLVALADLQQAQRQATRPPPELFDIGVRP